MDMNKLKVNDAWVVKVDNKWIVMRRSEWGLASFGEYRSKKAALGHLYWAINKNPKLNLVESSVS